MNFKDLITLIDNGTLDFYNFYDLDLPVDLFYACNYYLNIPENENTEQKLKIVFTDIEVYQENKNIEFKFDEYINPISSISFIYNNKIYSFFNNIHSINIDKNEWIQYFQNELIKSNYGKFEIDILIFNNELDLIKSYWEKIREIDPSVLSGWNSDLFDYPYIYNRLLLLTNDQNITNRIISRFSDVKLYKNKIDIPEYVIADLMFLYKPREDGGRNYGKKQSSYSLDYVSKKEINFEKFKHDILDLNEFFEKDPKNYLLYNIIDTILCFKLNEKLKHIELHNNIKRMMKSTFTKSLIGSSANFDSYILYVLRKNKKHIRFGINFNRSISIQDLQDLPKIKLENKLKFLQPVPISKQNYTKYVNKFEGAYVTETNPRIIKSGITFNLDAASMYPSIMLQHNISFDVYKARILSSECYKILNYLDSILGKEKNIPEKLIYSIFDLINKYIDSNNDIENKENFRRDIYFITLFLIKKLINSGLTLNQILKPSNNKSQFMLSFYLIHLLNIINWIHPNKNTYNDIVYDYLFNNSKNHKYFYIVYNPNNSNEYIEKLDISQLPNIVSKYSLTITGTCFEKHNIKLGIFTKLLKDLFEMRKFYQSKMKEFPENSNEWEFYDQRQNTVKIIMNSIYGTQGLKSFRYSNSHLANSITVQGQFIIKLAQYISNEFLKEKQK